MGSGLFFLLLTAITLASGAFYRTVVWDLFLLRRIPKKLKKLSKKDRKKFFKKIQQLTGPGAGMRFGLSYGFGVLGAAGIGLIMDLLAGGGTIFVAILLFLFAAGAIMGLSPKFSLLTGKGSLDKFGSQDIIDRVEATAVNALFEDKSKDAQIVLQGLVRKFSKPVSRLVVELAGELEDDWGVKLLAAGLRHPQKEVKSLALEKLAEKGPEYLQAYLPKLLKDHDPSIRQQAYRNIDLLPPEIAKPLLRIGTGDQFGKVRKEVAHAAQRIEAREELEWLEGLIEENAHPRYLQPLTELVGELVDGSWQSVKATRLAIPVHRNWEKLVPLLEDLKERTFDPVLVSVLHYLHSQDKPSANDAMVLLIGEKDPQVREVAIKLLRNQKSLTPTALKRMLDSKRTQEKTGAIEILGGINHDSVKGQLIQWMGHSDPEIRQAAIRATAGYEVDNELETAFHKLLRDPNLEVRREMHRWISIEEKINLVEPMLKAFLARKKSIREFSGQFEDGSEKELIRKYALSVLEKQSAYNTPDKEQCCLRCLTRTESVNLMKIDFNLCRRCRKGDQLIPGVKTIKGVIRTGFEDKIVREGTLEVDVWNEKAKQIRFADVDLLEIQGGGTFDYDWAVNAVAEALTNDTGRPDTPWEVQLTNRPSLGSNTMRLLRESAIRVYENE